MAEGGFSLLIPPMEDSGGATCDLCWGHGESADQMALIQPPPLPLFLRRGGPRGTAVPPGTGETNPKDVRSTLYIFLTKSFQTTG